MDDDIKNSNSLIRCLKNYGLNQFHFRNLILARQFPYYPKNPLFIEGIILISSDVSKLAYDTDTRIKIQKHIISFVEKGGVLVGTHDIIYRRARHELFESVFGCTITEFQRFNHPIAYTLIDVLKDHPLLEGLPPTFELSDSEVCWGTWTPDSLILAISKTQKALITTRNCERGVIIWLNSGDKQLEQCKSIATPEEYLLQILKNAILNKNVIIQYNKKHAHRKTTEMT